MSSDTAPLLEEFVKQLDSLDSDAGKAFAEAANKEQLEEARVEFLGARQGRLKSIRQMLGTIPKEDKPAAGKKLNEVKNAIQAGFDAAQDNLKGAKAARVRDPQFDPSLPGTKLRVGRLHPITQTIEELKDIMSRLGFTPAEGPEVEDPYHNFEALNIPQIHPARDPLDNFYLAVAGTKRSWSRIYCCEVKPARCRFE